MSEVVAKRWPRLSSSAPQLEVVEDLAVEDDPQRLVLVADRLLARAEVDDAEARVPEPDVFVKVDAELVGTAVADRAQHGTQGGLSRRRSSAEVAESDDAAHQRGPCADVAPVSPARPSAAWNRPCP